MSRMECLIVMFMISNFVQPFGVHAIYLSTNSFHFNYPFPIIINTKNENISLSNGIYNNETSGNENTDNDTVTTGFLLGLIIIMLLCIIVRSYSYHRSLRNSHDSDYSLHRCSDSG